MATIIFNNTNSVFNGGVSLIGPNTVTVDVNGAVLNTTGPGFDALVLNGSNKLTVKGVVTT